MKPFNYFKVLAFILFINSSVMAQEDGFLLDSTRETLTMGYGTYTRIKQYYYYNNFNQLKLLDTYTNKNSFPDTADMQNTGKAYHYYDNQHRIEKVLSQGRETWEPDWSTKSKTEYQYSDTTNCKTSYSWDFISGNWNNGNTKYIDSLKAPEELESSHLRQYWFDETGQWENDLWSDTVFLQPGMVDSVYQQYWVVGNPTVSLSYCTRYDYTYYPDTLFIYEYEVGRYVLKKIYYSDDSLKKYKDSYRVYYDSIIDTLNRVTRYYDSEQRLVKYENGWWNSGSNYYIVSFTIDYQYNDKGLLTQKDQYSGDHQRTTYEYNDNDLLWKETYYGNADDHSHCSTVYYYYSYTYVNISDQASDNIQKIVFYPNPSQSVIHFSSLENNEKQYQIYDITGRVIQQGKLFDDQHSLDVSSLIPGYYVAIIKSGGKNYQGKFIKY